MALSNSDSELLLATLKKRFETHTKRHNSVTWQQVLKQLELHPQKLEILFEMERTGGEPDVVTMVPDTGAIVFYDCAAESPSGRRSLCYDKEALDARKEFKPVSSALEMAQAMGVNMLNEAEYRFLQTLGAFDTKTSSWILTPEPIRKLGGALFADFRYDTVFVYHNGAQSYYAARGFRGSLTI